MENDSLAPQSSMDGRAARKRFDALILPRRELLNAAARRLTGGDRAESEDLVQETLVRAFTHIDSVTSEATVDGWLCTTLRNLYFNLYRKRRQAPFTVSLDESEELALPVAGGSPGSAEGVALRRFEYRWCSTPSPTYRHTIAFPFYSRTSRSCRTRRSPTASSCP